MKLIVRAISIGLVVWIAKSFAEGFKQKTGLRIENEKVDQMSSDSFPSSDPPSSWAGVAD